jgi:hypothetical protein
MTNADRRALAAALHHGRTRYAFRAYWWDDKRHYRWYHKPNTGWDAPALTATDLGGGQWVLTWPDGSHTVDFVGFALSVLAFFGVYQPAMAEVAG